MKNPISAPSYMLYSKSYQQIVEQIIGNRHPKFTLLGFSLGGRVALSLYEIIPEKIEKIILLAPDGLKVNSWYWLATQTWLGKHDRIILSSVGEKFRKGIEEHCTVTIIHSGHQVLHEKHSEEIVQALIS